jgi:putative Ca2+/H+ antiporter (TMEM165/GDT1 family)
MKPYVAVFVSVLLAELGDKTQIATLLFASDPALRRWAVIVAAGGALTLSTVLAVLAGTWISERVNLRHLRTAAALGFIAIGAWMLVRR